MFGTTLLLSRHQARSPQPSPFAPSVMTVARSIPDQAALRAAPSRRRLSRPFGAALLVAALAGCGGGSDDPKPTPRPATVSSVRIAPAVGSLEVGNTVQLAGRTLDATGATLSGRTITWNSLQPAIATVSGSGLVTGVTAGTVTITATADGVTGSATLAVLVPVAARCDATTPISVSQTVNGALISTDCKLADDTYADKFELTLTEAAPLRVQMNSAGVDAYLIVQNAVSGFIVVENDDGAGDTNARIEQLFPAGRYVIVANTFEANQIGDYSLSVTRANAACLTSTPITTPSTVNGNLTAATCVLADSSYADRYALTVTSATVLTATMRSDSVDAYLFIESDAGVSSGRNDNGGGGTDARAITNLDPGSYFIYANSSGPRDSGPYTLTLSSRIDPCGASRAVTVGQSFTDTLTGTGCRLADGSYVKRYAFAVAAAGAMRIDLTSTQFDPYLLLQQAGAAPTLAEDDDGGPGLNAQLLRVFEPGNYVITATSATSGELGEFRLALSGAAPGPVSVAITPAAVSLTPGLTRQLNAAVTGSTNTDVAWKSSAPGIAAVSSTGEVRAITAGAAIITATSAADPSKTGTADVTVTAGTDVNLDVPLVYLTQAVQMPDGRIPLVAERPTVARVFVRGSRSGLANAAVRLRIFNGATLVGTLTGTAVVGTALDEGCCSADIAVPNALIRDGHTYVADVDPANSVAESNEGDNSFPVTGTSKPMRVITVPPINIQLVPIRHQTTSNVGPASPALTRLIKEMYPLATVNVTVHAEYATDTPPLTDGASWIGMLREIEGLRALENSRQFYYGVLHQQVADGIIGIANLSGFVGLGISGPDGIANETLTHEFGHSFGRRHAPSPTCGAPAGVDQSFPRTDGTIGAFGFNVSNGAIFPSSRFDIMGYCSNTWASEYTYLGVLGYVRSGVIPISASVAATSPVLLITGSSLGGTLDVDPAFSHAMTPTPQQTAGRFVAEGLASDGRVLFRHRFDGTAVADADSSARTFTIAVPYDPKVGGAVASISVRDDANRSQPTVRARTGTYTGVPGGVSLRVDADPQLTVKAAGAGRYEISWSLSRYPSMVVRDRRSGRVLGIGRRGSMRIEATSLADLDAWLSDGVGSTARALGAGQAP